MDVKARRRRTAVYVSISLLTLAIASGGWLILDSAAFRDQAAVTMRDTELQTEMARSAMLEGFSRIIDESGILASYSLPEYLAGSRSRASMEGLFESEVEAFSDVLVYAYFDREGVLDFSRVSSAAGGGEALAQLTERSAKASAILGSGSSSLVVISGKGKDAMGRGEPRFFLFQAVRISGRLEGLVGVAVGLGEAIDSYLAPLAESGKTVGLKGPDGTVLWIGAAFAVGFPGGAFAASGDVPPAFAIERVFFLGGAPFSIRVEETEASIREQYGAIGRWRSVVFTGLLAFVAASAVGLAMLYLSGEKRRSLAREEERLVKAIAAREREIAESELRYERLFEEAGDGILILDEEGTIVRCNSRAGELFLRSREDMLGHNTGDFSPTLQPSGEPSAESLEAIKAVWKTGASQRFEWTHLRADGEPFVVEVSLSPLDFRGKLLAQAFIRDITERKAGERLLREALADRELLLRELHHRVKNNLQFMQSLIELQKAGEEAQARRALDRIQSRVGALSAAYFSIAGDIESLRLEARDFVTSICAQAREGRSARAARSGSSVFFDLACDELKLGLETAVPLGLLLRELVENALTHGSPQDAEARLEIGLAEEGRAIVLRVRDYGRGRAAGLEDGLGLTLARAMADQLGGVLSFEDAEPGLRARFAFSPEA